MEQYDGDDGRGRPERDDVYDDADGLDGPGRPGRRSPTAPATPGGRRAKTLPIHTLLSSPWLPQLTDSFKQVNRNLEIENIILEDHIRNN